MDLIFEIHNDLTEHPPEYPEWLARKNIPMIVGDEFPLKGKHITTYPYAEVRKFLDGDFLSSTPAYMMAYAILQGYEEITLLGIDMSVDDHEYFMQRPTMFAWIAYAKAKGIKINIPNESPLFKDTHIEGKTNRKEDGVFNGGEFLSMANQHTKAIADIEMQIDQLTSKIHTHNGCKQSYERLAKVARAISSGQPIKTLAETAVIK